MGVTINKKSITTEPEILESLNMFNGTNLILNSDLALVSTQVKFC